MRKKWLLSLFTLIVGFLVPFSVQSESIYENAPYITPVNPNGKKVLFDNTHAQTAGAADWVIDGGFSDFAEGLAAEGYYVKELRKEGPITLEDLKEYDVFVIPEANIPYKSYEQDAIATYVAEGGSVFYIGDHYNADRNKNRIDAPEAFNGYRRGAFFDMTQGMSKEERESDAMKDVISRDWLSDTFGVRFRYNALDNIDSPMIMDDAFGILGGVSDVSLHAGATLAITDNTKARGIVYVPNGLDQRNKWKAAADQGVYNGGGIAEGPYVAIGKKEAGKSAFLGDSSLVEDSSPKYVNEETGQLKRTYDGYTDKDNARFLIQLMAWLSKKEDYKDFTSQNISLSENTKLHDFEIPEKSVEPQVEPWAQPQKHYKWYDRSTFAPGSFGSTQTPKAVPEVDFVYDSPLVVGQVVKMRIVYKNYEPNTVLKDNTFGIYTSKAQGGLKQGEQVASTRIGQDAWKETRGYSNSYAVMTDENGYAEQEVSFKVDHTGEFNIRLRQGKNNLLTKTLKIAEASSNPRFELEYDQTVPVGQERKVKIKLYDAQANQTYDGYTLNVFNENVYLGNSAGSSFADTKIEGESWKGKRAPSDIFQLITDDKGYAEKAVFIRLTDAGSFNLSLEKDKEEVESKPITSVWYLPN